jgi:hypothetical protein
MGGGGGTIGDATGGEVGTMDGAGWGKTIDGITCGGRQGEQ